MRPPENVHTHWTHDRLFGAALTNLSVGSGIEKQSPPSERVWSICYITFSLTISIEGRLVVAIFFAATRRQAEKRSARKKTKVVLFC